MCPQKRLYNHSGKCYFITTKTYRSKKIFQDEKKIQLLLRCINHLRRKSYFRLYAWVILFDHIHLLLEVAGNKNISGLMQSIKGNFSWLVNRDIYDVDYLAHARKHELRARKHYSHSVEQAFQPAQKYREVKYHKIWQASFYDHIIRDEQDFNNHLNYIRYNPVKHKYVTNLDNWPWSSYNGIDKTIFF